MTFNHAPSLYIDNVEATGNGLVAGKQLSLGNVIIILIKAVDSQVVIHYSGINSKRLIVTIECPVCLFITYNA